MHSNFRLIIINCWAIFRSRYFRESWKTYFLGFFTAASPAISSVAHVGYLVSFHLTLFYCVAFRFVSANQLLLTANYRTRAGANFGHAQISTSAEFATSAFRGRSAIRRPCLPFPF